MKNNVIEMAQSGVVTRTGKLKTMNYESLRGRTGCQDVLRDHLRGTFRPGKTTQTYSVGDVILLTGRLTDDDGPQGTWAVGTVGVITSIEENAKQADRSDINLATGQRISVEWKTDVVEIRSDYTCVQGGFISLADRAEIFAQLI